MTINNYKMMRNFTMRLQPKLWLLSFFMLSFGTLMAQKTVTGTIVDNTNLPMIGVNVVIKGTTTGTITDLDGKYTIAVNSNDDILQYSMVGMLTEEIKVGEQEVINLTMVEDLVGLDEVIVVGYGVMKKSDVSGSIVSVGEEELSEVKSSNVLESIQGKAAGVDVGPSDGRAGAGVSMQIRGSRSLKADNSPLIIVDGIPYGKDIPLNSSDIASMEILKDASSTAIYGSRGANGVILITTKKGSSDRTKVYFNAYYGLTEPYQKVPVFDRNGYINAKWDANRDVSYDSITGEFTNWDEMPDSTVFTQAEQAGMRDGTYSDWQDITTRNGFRQEYNFGVLGGSENITYGTSLTYFTEKGVTLSDKYDRYTFKANADGKVSDRVSIGAATIISYSNRDGRGVRFTDAVRMSPIVPAFNDSTGKYIFDPDVGNPRKSPLAYTEDTESTYTTRSFSSVYGQFQLLPNLSFRTTAGADLKNTRFGYTYPIKEENGTLTESGVKVNNDYFLSWTNVLNYIAELNDNSLTITVGHEMQKWRNETFGMTAKDQPFDRNLYWNLGSASTEKKLNTYLSEKSLVSGFARVSYNYKNLLITQATGRFDGASQLYEGQKWDFFPSVSTALRLTEMPFVASTGLISDLKLRLGYGVSGNASVDPYSTLGSLNSDPSHYQFAGASGGYINYDGYRPEFLASQSLTWETTSQFNFGLDFGVFGNRLAGNIDAFFSKSENLLYDSKLALHTSYFAITENAASTESKGVEFMLKSININRGDFKWQTNLSLSYNTNTITALSGGVERNLANNWIVGEPIKIIYGFEKLGIWQLSEAAEASVYGKQPGDIKVRDVNGDGIISQDDDRIVLGTRDPKWFGSLINTFDYGNFDLTVNIYGKFGNIIDAGAYDFDPRMYDNILEIDYWTPHNATDDYPLLNAGQTEVDYEETLSYQKGDFLKLKNITLGYSFPSHILENVGISSFRLYVSSNNTLILYSQLKDGLDPERGGSINWPLARTYVVGLNVEF